MASTAAQLAMLGNDLQFQLRVRSLVLQQAAVVYAGAPQVPDTLRTFAKALMANPALAQNLAVLVANRTNVVAGNVTFDFVNGHAVTDVTDASLASQIATDWPMYAGV